MPTVTLVWIAIFVSGLTFNAYNGVGPQAVNQVTPNQYRAQVSAVYLFVVNALGLGVGPTLVPLLNDHLFHDPLKIRYSLIIVVFCSRRWPRSLCCGLSGRFTDKSWQKRRSGNSIVGLY